GRRLKTAALGDLLHLPRSRPLHFHLDLPPVDGPLLAFDSNFQLSYAHVCGCWQEEDCVSALRIVDGGCQRLCSCSWNAVHVERDLPRQLRPPPPPAYREGGERIGAVGLDLEGALLRFFYYIRCLGLSFFSSLPSALNYHCK